MADAVKLQFEFQTIRVTRSNRESGLAWILGLMGVMNLEVKGKMSGLHQFGTCLPDTNGYRQQIPRLVIHLET